MALDSCTSFHCEKLVASRNPFLASFKSHQSIHPGLGAVLVGHRCLVFGGNSKGVYTPPARYLYIYDLRNNSWTYSQIQNMQLVYGKVRVAFSKDAKLVAFTECKSNFSLAALDLVDPDYWYAIPATNAPDLHSGADGCYVEPRNEIVILGAQYRERGQQLNVYVCSLFKGEWQRTEVAGSAPLRRHSYSVCCEESQIFAIGGYEVEISMELSFNRGYIPRHRRLFRTVISGNRIFVFGGDQSKACFDIFLIRERSWIQDYTDAKEPYQLTLEAERMPCNQDCAVVLSPETLWVFGGRWQQAREVLKITPG